MVDGTIYIELAFGNVIARNLTAALGESYPAGFVVPGRGIEFVAEDAPGTARLWNLDSTGRVVPAHADLAYSPQNCFSMAAWISSGASSRTWVATDQEWPKGSCKTP